jgi:hypothetical protein
MTKPDKSLQEDGTTVPVPQQRWAYWIMDISFGRYDTKTDFHIALNEMGARGWRLVPMGLNEDGIVILERPL